MGNDSENKRSAIPQDSKRACLCRDGSYSKECCGKDYYSQGIGKVTGDGT